MPNKKYETDGVPERLRQITVETLPVDKLYVLDLDPFTKPQEVMYIDVSQADGVANLAIDGRKPLKPLDTSRQPDDETVILMRVWVRTSEGDLREGIVADCRCYNGRFDVVDGVEEIDFTDQEDAWRELDAQERQVLISAVIDNDDDGKVKVWGDSVFYEAAIYMANVVDGGYVDSSTVKSVEPKNKSKKKKTKKIEEI